MSAAARPGLLLPTLLWLGTRSALRTDARRGGEGCAHGFQKFGFRKGARTCPESWMQYHKIYLSRAVEYGDRLLQRSQDRAGNTGPGKRLQSDGADPPGGSRCLVLEARRQEARVMQPCSSLQRATVEGYTIISIIHLTTTFLMK